MAVFFQQQEQSKNDCPAGEVRQAIIPMPVKGDGFAFFGAQFTEIGGKDGGERPVKDCERYSPRVPRNAAASAIFRRSDTDLSAVVGYCQLG